MGRSFFFTNFFLQLKESTTLKPFNTVFPFKTQMLHPSFIESLALGCLETVASNDNQDSPQIDKGHGRAVLLRHFFLPI